MKQKILVLRLYEVVVNKTECTKLEQSSVINILVVVMWNPYEINKRMCDIYWEAKKYFQIS